MRRIIKNAQEFTVDLANELLAEEFGSDIQSVDVQPLGEGVGLLSSIGRATMTLASGQKATVIVKVVSQNDNVVIARNLNFYSNEVNFYRQLADQCPVRSPKCYFAEIDEDTQDFLLLLEDFGNEIAGDQLQGCSEELMTLAFDRAAEMHGMYWGKTGQIPWLTNHNDQPLMEFRRDVIYLPGVEPTINGFGDLFRGNLPDVVRKIGEQFADISSAAMSGTQTLTHGDYRIDNMLLPLENSKLDMIAVDWQNTREGNGTHDIAYFSAQSCDDDMRGETEMNMLRRYHDILTGSGVKNYSFDECLDHYRYNLMLTMITPVAVCGTLDPGNERGVELGRVMLSRSLAALESMACDQLLK